MVESDPHPYVGKTRVRMRANSVADLAIREGLDDVVIHIDRCAKSRNNGKSFKERAETANLLVVPRMIQARQ